MSSSVSALEVDIRPGSGLGIFELGASLWTVLGLLRGLPLAFPQVDVKYDPDSSSTTPIILHIRPHVDLLFSGHHQRLHTICVRKLRDPYPPVTLRYKGHVLSSSTEVLRRLTVNRHLGPTYSGEELRYPGVRFSFEEDGLTEGFKAPSSHSDHHRMQEVKRVLVSQKRQGEQDALDEVTECPVMAGDLARAVVKVHDGVILHFYPSLSPPIYIKIGETTAQDLAIDLGSPAQVHYKEDERMTIHSMSRAENDLEIGYFYNYFQHGIDFFLSGITHTVRKIILHSNIPGSPLFQRYKRCPWEIEGNPEDDEDDTPPRKHFYDRFETILHFLSPHQQRPPSMRLDRTDDESAITLPSATTRLLGYDGIILEVTDASQVAAVMLF